MKGENCKTKILCPMTELIHRFGHDIGQFIGCKFTGLTSSNQLFRPKKSLRFRGVGN